jgi:hypothetical protein
MSTYILAELAEFRMADLRQIGPAHAARSCSPRPVRRSVGRAMVRWGERLETPAARPATQ